MPGKPRWRFTGEQLRFFPPEAAAEACAPAPADRAGLCAFPSVAMCARCRCCEAVDGRCTCDENGRHTDGGGWVSLHPWPKSKRDCPR